MSLKVENLTKTFGSNIAVNDLNFSMDKPGVFGLIGTNGAGKTTTIRMILGIMSADRGKATWNGNIISRETLSFGYMPEERGIYTKSKVLEQLIYFGKLRGMTKAAAKQSALSLMDRLGVSKYKDVPAEKLSKGNQQKIQLISTLIHNPQLLVLDEPFSGLDPINAQLLDDLIDSLVKDGKYILMSSHQMSTVENYCENLVLLSGGNTLLSGNLREIKASYGHTNLLISCKDDTSSVAEKCGMTPFCQTAEETEYKIANDIMAQKFLRELILNGIYPVKYEIKEPSLQEIFIEKVGAAR